MYVSHEGHLRQPTTNELEAEPAAKGRGNEGQMRRSHAFLRPCRDVRRPRHLPNAKITAILQSHPDGTTKNKYRISETPRPGRYTIKKIIIKKKKKDAFFLFIRPRYTIRTCINRTPPATRIYNYSLLFILTGRSTNRVAFSCCRVPLSSFPWPIQDRPRNA